MGRHAIISDVHGNLHALEAVMYRLGGLEVDGLICLGDIVGYGPFPEACLDLMIKHCAVIVRGNHDEAVVDPYTASMFNGPARDAIHWTRERLGPLHLDALNRLKAVATIEDIVMCIHDSPMPGPTDYVHDKRIAALAFRGVEKPVCLIGHTHVPMIFETPVLDQDQQLSPTDVVAYIPSDGTEHELSESCRYICNPGSVGQPRDCDPRASFAVLDVDARTFTVHRQEYDVAAAQHALEQAGLPTVLADRLAVGA